MKILIVAATRLEIQPLEDHLLNMDEQNHLRKHAVELMITGAGSVFTAFQLGKMLPLDNWDLAINLGICGSFIKEIPVGTTVNVVEDTFGDFGAEDGDSVLNAFEMGLMQADTFPFINGWIENPMKSMPPLIQSIPRAKGITMNTVSGNEHRIARLTSKFHADIESMEGAAFMYCCLKESIPFLQLRTVSNYVQKRDKSKWDIPLAIKKLNETAIRLLDEVLANGEW
ncbi:MAG TPA: futalosine hydrolase [Chitinophagales bacterium]|nr:futalosine hydrolase [Chitinophagales bacterium]